MIAASSVDSPLAATTTSSTSIRSPSALSSEPRARTSTRPSSAPSSGSKTALAPTPGTEVGSVQALAGPGQQDEAHEVGDVALELGLGELTPGREAVRVPDGAHWPRTFVWKPLTIAVPCGPPAALRQRATELERSTGAPST